MLTTRKDGCQISSKWKLQWNGRGNQEDTKRRIGSFKIIGSKIKKLKLKKPMNTP